MSGINEQSNQFSTIYEQIRQNIDSGHNPTVDDIQRLVDAAQRDGISQVDEKDAFFNIGKMVHTLDARSIRTSWGEPIASDILSAFESGRSIGASRQSIQENTQQSIESVQRQQYLSEQQSSGGLVNMFRSAAQSISNDERMPQDLRILADDWSVPDDVEQLIIHDSAHAATVATDTIMAPIEMVTRAVAVNTYHRSEADSVNCVPDALTQINPSWNIPRNRAVEVREGWLQEHTGIKWDGINLSRTSETDLLRLLSGKENQSLVVDGGHAYVYRGIEPDNDRILVYDASARENKVLSLRNSSVTVFVQGDGDGNLTGRARANGVVRTFNNMGQLSRINSSDINSDGNNNSWQIRKLFVLMADPAKRDMVAGLSAAIKAEPQDINRVNQILRANGISLNEREVRAMMTILKAPITNHDNPPSGIPTGANMIDMFIWLSHQQNNGRLSPNQENYMSQVQYSNVNLRDYFSTSRDASEKANDMYNVFCEVVEGRTGC